MSNQHQSKEVCSENGCTHRQLQYWEKKGYIKPDKGQRNVRLYTENDLKVIKQMVGLKKRGNSLGEAFIRSSSYVKPTSTVQSNNKFLFLKETEEKYLAENEELLNTLFHIQETEASIPGYPYSVYNEENILKLKELQDKAQKIKQQKNETWEKILIILKSDPSMIKKAQSSINKPPTINKYTVDQLILLWIKKNGTYDSLPKIRENYLDRIKNGESIDALVQELEIQPEKSR
jgi:DNA-binding transcriptional MerR regulator